MSPSKLLPLAPILIALVLWGAPRALGQASEYKVNVLSPSNLGLRVQTDTAGGQVASFGPNGDFQIDAGILRNGKLLVVPGGRFAVTEAGRVGIGTSTPDEMLTVVGTIQSTFGGFKFPDNSVQTSAGNAASPTYTSSQGTSLTMPAAAPATVLHLNLPNGIYLLVATVDFFNVSNNLGQNNNRDVNCKFAGDSGVGWVGSIAGLGYATASFHDALSVSSGGVDVTCSTSQLGVNVLDRRLTATKLDGSLTTQ